MKNKLKINNDRISAIYKLGAKCGGCKIGDGAFRPINFIQFIVLILVD